MKLIVGLGNPGKEYVDTRHNVGFMIVDKIWEDFSAHGGPASGWEFNKKFNAEISKRNDILLVKPQTFMNLSGEAVRTILDFYKLAPDDIIVIHDDLDIPIGKYKIATDSSAAGHNGVQNIIDRLGTQRFKRIRVGIKPEPEEVNLLEGEHLPRHSPAETGDYVLDKFSEEEIKNIAAIEPAIIEEIEKLLK